MKYSASAHVLQPWIKRFFNECLIAWGIKVTGFCFMGTCKDMPGTYKWEWRQSWQEEWYTLLLPYNPNIIHGTLPGHFYFLFSCVFPPIFLLADSIMGVFLAAHCPAMWFARKSFIASYFSSGLCFPFVDRHPYPLAVIRRSSSSAPLLHMWMLALPSQQEVCR